MIQDRVGDFRSSNIVILRQGDLERLFVRLSTALKGTLECEDTPDLYDVIEHNYTDLNFPTPLLPYNTDRRTIILNCTPAKTFEVALDNGNKLTKGITIAGNLSAFILVFPDVRSLVTRDLYVLRIDAGTTIYAAEVIYHPERRILGRCSQAANPLSPSGIPPGRSSEGIIAVNL